jgi:hypothetical protein
MADTLPYIVLIVLVGLMIVSLQTRFAAVNRRLDRLARLEGKLDSILKHLGLSFDPLGDIPADALAALREGRKVEAIKRYRAATGVGLAEAKDRIDEALRRTSSRS